MTARNRNPLVQCPACKGKKTLDCTIHESGKPPHVVTLGCVTCDGKGKITAAKARAEALFRASWCQCDEVGDNIQYYPDGAHPDCHKHHYRHEPGCGGIVQIG